MDRASASEAGNVGSTPAERKFENPALCGVFNLGRSRQTALPASGVEGRSDVFVCAHKKGVNLSRKAKTARPGPKDFYVRKNTAGESRRPDHLESRF